MNDSTSKKVTLIIATASSFFSPFLYSSVSIALPSIGQEFSVDAILLGWIATSYLLASAMFLVPFGRIADIHGRKKVFIYGIAVYTVSSFLAAISTSAMMLILFRVLQGIGSAMIFGTGVAILTSVFPVNERGKALGINVAAVYLGLSLGPFLGGLLTQYFGWRSVFLVNIPLGLIVLILALWKLKGEWAEARGESFDIFGSAVYGITLVAIIYGFSLLPTITGALLVLAGAIGLLVFFKWELRTKNPVVNISLFRKNAGFAFSNLAALINYSATFAVTFLLSLYLQYAKGLSPQAAGLVLVSQPVVMTIFSPLAGRLSDRIEPRVLASIGMALSVVGLSLMAAINENTGMGLIIASLVVVGLAFALFSSPNTNAVMSSVEKRFYGVAAATLGTMRLTGSMLSMGIVMIIFTLYIGRVQITPEYYHSFVLSEKVAFIIFAVLCFGGIFASLARGKRMSGY